MVGTLVEVEGKGYQCSEDIQVDFGRMTNVAMATTNNDGGFATNFVIDTPSHME